MLYLPECNLYFDMVTGQTVKLSRAEIMGLFKDHIVCRQHLNSETGRKS